VVTERGILAGIVILVVAVLPRWLGMAWLFADARDRWSPDTVLGYGYALGALGTIVVLSGGFNDLWFTVAASAPLAVLSAAGVAGGWSWLSQISWTRNLSSLILGAFSALLAVLLWPSGSSGILGIGWRWAAPLAALTALALGAIVIAARSSLSPWRTWLAVFVIAGVVAAVPSRFIYAVAAQVETTYPTSTSTVLFSPPSFDKAWRGGERGGWSDSEALAGEWLRRNAPPTDLLATNVTSSALVTALTRLPTYVSAIRFQSAYGRADDYPKIETRERASWEFIDNPSLATAFPLCEAGVDWLWIDPRVSSSVTWEPFADVRFAEDDVVILEFNSELCPN